MKAKFFTKGIEYPTLIKISEYSQQKDGCFAAVQEPVLNGITSSFSPPFLCEDIRSLQV